ncbi:FadR/GntR family transcriptional regulator [Nitriliruptor alkaliphilus]|uniref:FadR/GntR family transcriptional regulator n=1 Tax=Nitriliruptor alkaliphilus TaxID=427918 RepID=UPI000697DCDC|nr:FadR/GntR family transcriptional regulator [Nitriliruptor alkaliphilus]
MSSENARTVLAAKRPASPMLGVVVVEGLVDAIVSGRFLPGESLPPEGPLSEEFGVSRTVIRESVKRVEEKGLLTVARGRGTVVRPMTAWNPLDRAVLTSLIKHDETLGTLDELSTVRAQLESVMAAEAARLRNDGQLEALDAAMDRMRETVDDEAAFRAADVVFHETVMELSGNRLASSIARILMDRAQESSRYHGVDVPGAFTLTLREHEAVHAAITGGDPERAREAMTSHILESWQRRRLPNRAGRSPS